MSKKCVIVCAGLQSVHRLWNISGEKDFDTYIVCYNYEAYDNFKNDAGQVLFKVGSKYTLSQKLIEDRQLALEYDYFCFIDDDCVTTAKDINRLFKEMERNKFEVIHPSIEPKYNLNTIIHPNYETEYRFTNWSEISCLFMSKSYLAQVIELFNINTSGWGLPELFFNKTQIPFVIYDSISVQDGRPLNEGFEPLYPNLAVAYQELSDTLPQELRYEHKILGFKLKNLISFCIIFNKEKACYMPDCINSLPPDSEVVLVETIKDDEKSGLDEITKNGNNIYAKYYYKEWSYCAARNACKSLATRPIIFSIDSDERLAQHQHTAILKAALDLNRSEFAGLKNRNISMAPLPTMPGNYAATISEQVRIFRNIPQLTWQGIIHENIEKSMLDNGWLYADSNILIHHVGYEVDPQTLRDKHLDRLKGLINDEKNRNEPSYMQYIITEAERFTYYNNYLERQKL